MSEIMFTVSLFDHIRDTLPREASRTWAQMCARFERPAVRAGKDGPLFAPALFCPAYRLLENVRTLSMLVLDYDHRASFDDDLQTWRELGCRFAAYTTHSHKRVTEKNPDAEERFRVVVPLAEPIPAEKFPALWRWAARLTGGKVDAQAQDASRIYYTPAIADEGAPYQFDVVDGPLLDWGALDLEDRPEPHAADGEIGQTQIGGFSSWDELHAEAGRLIRVASGARVDRRGWAHAPGVCHGSVEGTALFVSPEGVYGCHKGCQHAVIREALGLPSSPSMSGRKEGDTSSSAFPAFSAGEVATMPELSPVALYGLAGDIVSAVSPHSEAHPAALLVQTLVAFGNCVGRTAYFRAEADRHYLNLFVTLVGATSKGRKGTSWGQVRRFFEAVDSDWAANCIQHGLSTGEGLIWALRDDTGEDEDEDEGRAGGDKRLMVVESEFASVLRVMSRQGNTLSAVIRQAWDAGDLRIMTKNSPARVTGGHISIVAHVTQEELRRNLSETESANGFANRFLWVATCRSKLLPEGGALSDGDCNPLVLHLRDALVRAHDVGEMARDEAARRRWHDIYAELSEGQAGLVGAVTSRAEAQTMRLACLYALLDCSQTVRAPHLEAALALWRYAEASARYVFGSEGGDRVAAAIVKALGRAGGRGLSRSELNDLFSGHQRRSVIDSALETLLSLGRAHPVVEESGGRPATRWFVGAASAEHAGKAE